MQLYQVFDTVEHLKGNKAHNLNYLSATVSLEGEKFLEHAVEHLDRK